MIRDALAFRVENGVAQVEFTGDDRPERYDLLLVTTCRHAFADPGVHRIELDVAIDDRPRRHALHRAGFRMEALRRQRLKGPDGGLRDEAGYSLLRGEAGGSAGFTGVMNSVTPRKRAIGHLLLTDAQGDVCLLETSFKVDWELPGGILNVAETPRQGVIREVFEELSYGVSVGRLLVVDWLAPYLGWEDALELIFDGGVLPERSKQLLRPDLREIRSVHWLSPQNAADRMAPFARGRLAAALAAREEGRTLYLEAGERIS